MAPVIADETADIDAMIPLLLKGGFYHAGQVCVSVQRVFVPHALAKDIAGRLAEGADRLVVGDAVEERTEVGPLIRPREVERVAEWVTEASSGGGKILAGGTLPRQDEPGHPRASQPFEIGGQVLATTPLGICGMSHILVEIPYGDGPILVLFPPDRE